VIDQFAHALKKALGLLERRGQIIEPQRRKVGRQQRPEGFVHQENLAVNVGDNYRLLGNTDMATELFQLVLHDKRAYRPELQHEVRHRLADQASRGDIGGRPRLGGALHQLMPLGERAPRR